MTEEKRVGSFALVVSLTLAAAFAGWAFSLPTTSAYTLRAPIVIWGNADFTAANGVTGGSGTPSDPYVISGWEIDGSADSGIEVYNTNAHFVIRDVYIHSAIIDGIFFYGLQNGRLENAVLAQNDWGIYIQSSSNVTAASSNISYNFLDAVEIDASSNVTVEGNAMWGNGDWGIFAYDSDDLVIRNNTISNNGWAGIELSWYVDRVLVEANVVENNNVGGLILDTATNVTALGNTFRENDFNVDMTDAVDVLLRDNVVATSTSDGVTITGGARITVDRNNITGNGGGVLVVGSTALLVRHNQFNANAWQATDNMGSGNLWDDGYPSGGNYWSDYAGVDDCSGVNQDVCPSPDGIGDTPYAVDADTEDRYPLMDVYSTGGPPLPPAMLPAQLAGVGLSDVALAWLPSPDDGGGDGDVVTYEVYAGAAYDPSGATYAMIATLPAGTTGYVHSGAGAGNAASFFYQVRAVDSEGLSAVAVEQSGKVATFLTAGRHLVSVPFEQADGDLDVVLQGLSWTQALTYDASGGSSWLAVVPSKARADFATMTPDMAFWLDVSSDEWWTTAGRVPSSTAVVLSSGWNLVGYPSLVPRPIGDVLAGVNAASVQGFAAVPPYYVQTMTAMDSFVPGQGYWVYNPGPDVVVAIIS